MLNWDVISALAEIIGAMAVVISIIYLARQVSHANQTATAATTLDSTRLLAEWHRGVNQSPELAGVLVRGMEDTSALSNDERASFLTLVAEIFVVFEGLYRQHKMGFLAAETWNQIEETIVRMFMSEGIEIWWDSAVSMNGSEFRDYVDQIRGRTTDPDWINRMTGQIQK